MDTLNRTVFFDRHVALGAQIVPFGGWEMPIQYPSGIVEEHLATRKSAGLFDVSHMGRFRINGSQALPFMQFILSNNAAALDPGESQYTIIQNESGGAIDDAYLYRFVADEYLLVVNAANRQKDWDHFQAQRGRYPQANLTDLTAEMAMLSLQGPLAKDILNRLLDSGRLPEPMRNRLSRCVINGADVNLARTGYTGEPICFELFVDRENGPALWDALVNEGAVPVGLGARDTLRLEAALPLYGHELGLDPEKKDIPLFASPLSRFAVSLSPCKGDFFGRRPLETQFEALKAINDHDFSRTGDLPRRIQAVALVEKGVPRAGYPVYRENECVGHMTSGTMVPYWEFEGRGIGSRITDRRKRRAIGLALVNSRLFAGDEIQVDIRGRRTRAVIVPYHMRSEAPPYARAILWNELEAETPRVPKAELPAKAEVLVKKALDNHRWRQQACVNLIPSEQTQSAITRVLSILDPIGRYAEHKPVTAFSEENVFYYQGTDFIAETERLLEEELKRFLECAAVETRLISGQMANMAFFSAMVDYVNRVDRKSEQRRIRKVLNHHIIKGGHLSAQPMGALRDYVARDPRTEKAAVVNFPVLKENPYKIDVAETKRLIDFHRPELIIFGKSMIIHKEPVRKIRGFVDELGLDCTIMYDMAHVLGLVGGHFQKPFAEGADIVTGSTHKSFFGTQRGIIGSDIIDRDPRIELWKAVRRRAFPGSVSNHHLGTLLGLLMATYEMNHFKHEYQPRVIENAKAFAAALNDCGLAVSGDPEISFTETHQVLLEVGFARAPEIARSLEENNIIVNYQASPHEEGFTASGSLRMGVQEMTRFGMGKTDFEELAQLFKDALKNRKAVKEAVIAFRRRFLDLQYCFSLQQFSDVIEQLNAAVR